MKTQELRYDNIVSYKDTPVQIKQVGKLILIQGSNCPSGKLVSIEDLKPLELTKDLVISMGFIPDEVNFDGYCDESYIKTIMINEWEYDFVIESDFSFGIQYKDGDEYMPVHNRKIYLHELQNIILDLTEEELNIDIYNIC